MIPYVLLPRQSLLFGYSCSHLLTQVTTSVTRAPNLDETQNETIHGQLLKLIQPVRHLGNQVIGSERTIQLESAIRHLGAKFYTRTIISINLFFLSVLVVITFQLQPKLLRTYGITKATELSYKVLQNIPPMHKVCLLLCSLFIAQNAPKNWLIFDRFPIFSIGIKQQVRYFLLSLICGAPDGLASYIEIHSLFSLLPNKTDYQLLRLVHDQAIAGWPILIQLLLLIPIVLSILSSILRYSPLLNMLYASACVWRHLRNLNQQILVSRAPNNLLQVGSSLHTPRPNSAAVAAPPEQLLGQVANRKQLQRAMEVARPQSVRPAAGWPKSETDKTTTCCGQLNSIQKQRPTSIENIRQLESHLELMAIFVKELDCSMSMFVYALSLLSLSQCVYAVLFTIKLELTVRNLGLGLAFSLCRLVLPISLLCTGQFMAHEARRLLHQLEHIFAQDSSEMLVYKQHNESIHSWRRIFSSLERIQFNCDHLLRLDLSTVVKFSIYAMSSIFIILQFGKLGPG